MIREIIHFNDLPLYIRTHYDPNVITNIAVNQIAGEPEYYILTVSNRFTDTWKYISSIGWVCNTSR